VIGGLSREESAVKAENKPLLQPRSVDSTISIQEPLMRLFQERQSSILLIDSLDLLALMQQQLDHYPFRNQMTGVGSIKDYMNLALDMLNKAQIAVVCCESLKGLIYLHSKNIIHSDIKADFVGSPLWMAPDVIMLQGYSFKVTSRHITSLLVFASM
jgi:hypothetical protein